jgi:hemin uptake protein HemP
MKTTTSAQYSGNIRRPVAGDFRAMMMVKHRADLANNLSVDTQPEIDLPVDQTPVVRSEALLKEARVVLIQHKGELYRLQETRAGKLILTK